MWLERLGLHHSLWLVVERQADGPGAVVGHLRGRKLSPRCNATPSPFLTLDTEHWTPDCNAADFGHNPIWLSVLSLGFFASQFSISCIVLAVIDIGELFFFLFTF